METTILCDMYLKSIIISLRKPAGVKVTQEIGITEFDIADHNTDTNTARPQIISHKVQTEHLQTALISSQAQHK
jgi:hypothetical protein